MSICSLAKERTRMEARPRADVTPLSFPWRVAEIMGHSKLLPATPPFVQGAPFAWSPAVCFSERPANHGCPAAAAASGSVGSFRDGLEAAPGSWVRASLVSGVFGRVGLSLLSFEVLGSNGSCALTLARPPAWVRCGPRSALGLSTRKVSLTFSRPGLPEASLSQGPSVDKRAGWEMRRVRGSDGEGMRWDDTSSQNHVPLGRSTEALTPLWAAAWGANQGYLGVFPPDPQKQFSA